MLRRRRQGDSNPAESGVKESAEGVEDDTNLSATVGLSVEGEKQLDQVIESVKSSKGVGRTNNMTSRTTT